MFEQIIKLRADAVYKAHRLRSEQHPDRTNDAQTCRLRNAPRRQVVENDWIGAEFDG